MWPRCSIPSHRPSIVFQQWFPLKVPPRTVWHLLLTPLPWTYTSYLRRLSSARPPAAGVHIRFSPTACPLYPGDRRKRGCFGRWLITFWNKNQHLYFPYFLFQTAAFNTVFTIPYGQGPFRLQIFDKSK